MGVLLLVLLLALILGGLGFAVHVLWWIALIVLAIWVIGFFMRSADFDRPASSIVNPARLGCRWKLSWARRIDA